MEKKSLFGKFLLFGNLKNIVSYRSQYKIPRSVVHSIVVKFLSRFFYFHYDNVWGRGCARADKENFSQGWFFVVVIITSYIRK